MPAGIQARHRRTCPGARADGKCCKPGYRAEVYDHRADRKIRRTFDTRAAAKLWRQDALVALRQGKLAEAKPSTTVRAVCEAWLADARRGIVRARGGFEYKPGSVVAYEQELRLRVYPDLGTAPFYRVRRRDVQELVDGFVARGCTPATIAKTIGALGAVYSRAIHLDELEVSPTAGVKLPTVSNGRERFATPGEAAQLLAAVPEADRGIWATAMYAGLRRGEIGALRWADVDLKAGTIDVTRSWDPTHGYGDTKSRNRRKVPIITELREQIAAARLRQAPGAELCFAGPDGRPFRADVLQARADAGWEAAELTRLTLHDCRHTFASLAIAAGVNAKALSIYLGHSTVAITLDRYGHLMPGNEAEAAGLLDTYLAAAVWASGGPVVGQSAPKPSGRERSTSGANHAVER